MTLDDATLMALAQNPDVVSAFPVFQAPTHAARKAAASRTGGCCPTGSPLAAALRTVKAAVAAMAADKAAELKTLLRTDTLTVHVEVNGRVQQYTV